MARAFFRLLLVALLSQTGCSAQQCNRTLSGNQITFVCPSTITSQELNLYDLTSVQLDAITTFVATGSGGTASGPFTSIPPNICLMRNLQSISFANNKIATVDPAGTFTSCLSGVTSIDLSLNGIRILPSAMIYSMKNLANVSFQHNQLADVPSIAFPNPSTLEYIDFSYNQLTTFEFWTFFVQQNVDFSNNKISTITNKYFTQLPLYTASQRSISLVNNSAVMNLTDAIYPMYNSCNEVIDEFGLPGSITVTDRLMISWSLAKIDFGQTQFNCSCDQYYLGTILDGILGGVPSVSGFGQIFNTTCLSGLPFRDGRCGADGFVHNSTIDFTQVYPRQCKIYADEPGNLTIVPNATVPTVSVSRYPHYESRPIGPGACFFTFTSAIAMSIHCVNDTPYSFPSLPNDILTSSYLTSITRVTLPTPMSVLPQYLCSLPSHQIDLSNQQFTTLSLATFPCLDWFHSVNLEYNSLSSVNMPSGNFTNLTSLDLSNNNLTSLPYSILRPTPSSLSYLDLRNNSISAIDLFLYTLKNITVRLEGNPINSLNITNTQNVSIPITSSNDSTSPGNISLPSTLTGQLFILNDQEASTARVCTPAGIEAFLAASKLANASVQLDCSCASISLKTVYASNGTKITNRFTCMNGTNAVTFNGLTSSDCPSPLNLTATCGAPLVTSCSLVPTTSSKNGFVVLNESRNLRKN